MHMQYKVDSSEGQTLVNQRIAVINILDELSACLALDTSNNLLIFERKFLACA